MVYLEWAEISFIFLYGFAYKNLFLLLWRKPLGVGI